MNISECYPSSRLSVPSPSGTLVATVYQSRLIIRSSKTGSILQNYILPSDFGSSCRHLKWYGRRHQLSSKSQRLLVVNDDSVLVYDAGDSEWQAKINGAAGGIGRIASVNFGYTPDEILVFSDFGVKVTIWSLITNRGVEIRDPKPLATSYDYRASSGHVAILTRAAAHDTLMLLEPGSHELLASVELTTVDAQGIQWSPDNRWIAIWDTASSGYRVLIYTADGHLFKTYEGGQDTDNIGLGIKSLQWSPSANLLAIGDCDQTVMILSKNTFSPTFSLEHPTTISFPRAAVWQEQINASNQRSWIPASQVACPPTEPAFAPVHLSRLATDSPRRGISIVEFNSDGNLIATRSDFLPSTIWIWSSSTAAAIAILIHFNPVQAIQWHPTIPNLLLIRCAISESIVHMWKDSWQSPQVVPLDLDKMGGKMESTWLHTEANEVPMLMLGNKFAYKTAQLLNHEDGALWPRKGVSVGVGPEDMFDEGNSLDFSPVKTSFNVPSIELKEDSPSDGNFGQPNLSDEVDDTFHYRRHTKVPEKNHES